MYCKECSDEGCPNCPRCEGCNEVIQRADSPGELWEGEWACSPPCARNLLLNSCYGTTPDPLRAASDLLEDHEASGSSQETTDCLVAAILLMVADLAKSEDPLHEAKLERNHLAHKLETQRRIVDGRPGFGEDPVVWHMVVEETKRGLSALEDRVEALTLRIESNESDQRA